MEFALARHVQRRTHPYDEDESGVWHRGAVFILIVVVLVAFGGFVWNIYGGSGPARITPPPGAYKSAPPSEFAAGADITDDNAMYGALESGGEGEQAAPVDGPEAPLAEEEEESGPPRLSAPPAFVSNGPYLAQVAALQSEPAVQQAWARLSSRAPDLFARAHLDVERADLGQRGVYYRVRAGYFADRGNAGRFCDRIKQMGQDCIVVAR